MEYELLSSRHPARLTRRQQLQSPGLQYYGEFTVDVKPHVGRSRPMISAIDSGPTL